MGSQCYTTDQYIVRAREVHGDKYDYSSVEYTHNKNKVTIICPEHGIFTQMARAHLKGQGCRKCFESRVKGWKNEIRLKAQASGEKFYEGSPCKNGHTTRYVANNSCVTCGEVQRKTWRLNNKERHREMTQSWRDNNPERAARTNLLRSRVRNKRTQQASILWKNQKVRDKINAVYDAAKQMSEQCGQTLHVDHIIPLAAKNVCGLHVPWNLQITTAKFNISKQNKLEDYLPDVTDWRNSVLVHSSALPWKLQEKR